MRINPDFILRTIIEENVIVPTGEAARNINGIINVNESAAFIWKQIEDGKSMTEIVELLVHEFEVDKKIAEKDVTGLISELIEIGMVLEH